MNITCVRIKQLREGTGLSQKDFADNVGIKQTTYNGYETGKHQPKSDVLILLADKCGVTVDYLLGATDEKKPTPVSEGGLMLDDQTLLNAFHSAPKDTREAIRLLLKVK